MSDLTAEDFEAIIGAMLDRIERVEREGDQIRKAARESEARLLSEIARLNARLLAYEVPLIREYYRDGVRPAA